MKNIGEKTTNLFERKKKEVGDLATEKASEAQTYAEEQAKKAGDAIEETKNEASGILGNACKTIFKTFHLIAEVIFFGMSSFYLDKTIFCIDGRKKCFFFSQLKK